MAIITWIKPSGAEIEASNSAETRALAKQLGWKKKKTAAPLKEPTQVVDDLLTGADNGDSGPSSESDTSGDISSGDGS